MRSLLEAVVIAIWLSGSALTYAAPAAPAGAPPTPAAVREAIERLRLDPNLGSDKKIKSLHWIDGKSEAPKAAEAYPWIIGLFEFLSQAGSLLLWMAGAIGLSVATIWVLRVIKSRQPERFQPNSAAATHVQDMDIRPASLPDDIGAAALALNAAGRTRDALSLLYRGALSRVVNNFSVVIGASYTEGEALRAVQKTMEEPRVHYFSTLVRLWQRAVYAAELPAAESVDALCTEFSHALGDTPI